MNNRICSNVLIKVGSSSGQNIKFSEKECAAKKLCKTETKEGQQNMIFTYFWFNELLREDLT